MRGIETGDETAVLQGAQLGGRTFSAANDIIKGVLQSCGVFVGPLMLKVHDIERNFKSLKENNNYCEKI